MTSPLRQYTKMSTRQLGGLLLSGTRGIVSATTASIPHLGRRQARSRRPALLHHSLDSKLHHSLDSQVELRTLPAQRLQGQEDAPLRRTSAGLRSTDGASRLKGWGCGGLGRGLRSSGGHHARVRIVLPARVRRSRVARLRSTVDPRFVRSAVQVQDVAQSPSRDIARNAARRHVRDEREGDQYKKRA